MKQLPPNLLDILIAVVRLSVFFIRVTVSWDQPCVLEPSSTEIFVFSLKSLSIFSCIWEPSRIQGCHAIQGLNAVLHLQGIVTHDV